MVMQNKWQTDHWTHALHNTFGSVNETPGQVKLKSPAGWQWRQKAPMLISSEPELSDTCSPHSHCKVYMQLRQSNVVQRTMLPQLTTHPAGYVVVVDASSAFLAESSPREGYGGCTSVPEECELIVFIWRSRRALPCRLERQIKTGSTTRTVPLNIMVTIRYATIWCVGE